MRIAILTILLFIPLIICSQTKMTGTITDQQTGKAIEHVIVTVVDGQQDILGYSLSDKKGFYEITISSSVDKFTVIASLLGYTTKELTVENKTRQLDIKLDRGAIELKEVVIDTKAMWGRGDTIVYNTATFRSKADRTIGDVLKKLPGIEVSPSGSIKYHGESINKFYIEGLDLLESRYGIATNNVQADDVVNVEVIENHQPVKALKGISETGQAAINLKLKENRLFKPIGTVDAAAGADQNDFLWLLNAFALQTQKKNQTIVMYKSNNTGDDISGELTSHSLGSEYSANMSVLSAPTNKQLFSTGEMSRQKRYAFNNTHIASLNNLLKVNKDAQLRFNIDYIYDQRDDNRLQNSRYVLNDSMIVIDERRVLNNTSNHLNGMLTYYDNSAAHYLKNQLSTNLSWNKSVSDISMQNHVNQRYSTPQYNLSNQLQYMKRINSRVFNLSSVVHYSSLPQSLRVDVDTLDNDQKQITHYTGLYANVSVLQSFSKGYSRLEARLDGEGFFESFGSDLNHHSLTDSVANELKSDMYTLTLTPSYTYKRGRLLLILNVNFKQYWLDIDDELKKNKHRYTPLYALPRLTVNYKFSPYWESTMSYRLNKRFGDLLNFTSAPVMLDYRTISVKSGILTKQETQSASARINYRNPVSTLFFNTSVTYIDTKRNTMRKDHFSGIESTNGNTGYENHMKNWLWAAYTGKYLSEIRTSVSLSASYSHLTSEMMRQDVLMPVTIDGWLLSAMVNTKITENMNFSYNVNYTTNGQKTETQFGASKSDTYQFQHAFKYFYSLKKLSLEVQCDLLNNKIEEGVHTNTFFADANLKYNIKQTQLMISLNNIFNKKEYRYISYNNLDSYEYIFRLRPFSITAGIIFKF